MAYEIERKYIIKMPDTDFLCAIDGCKRYEITQTYLLSADGETARVRKSVESGHVTYTKTVKVKQSNMTRIENEDNISENEYNCLLNNSDDALKPIYKTRYTFYIEDQKFEIDIYPFWHYTAILETELESEDTVVTIPAFLHVLREVTDVKGYSNKSFAKRIPPEDING